MRYEILFNNPISALGDFRVEREADHPFAAIHLARADYPEQRTWRVTAASLDPVQAGSCTI